MTKTLRTLFSRKTTADVIREQYTEAERLAVEHRAAGELHSGLAAIYDMRANRLRAQMNGQVAKLVAAK